MEKDRELEEIKKQAQREREITRYTSNMGTPNALPNPNSGHPSVDTNIPQNPQSQSTWDNRYKAPEKQGSVDPAAYVPPRPDMDAVISYLCKGPQMGTSVQTSANPKHQELFAMFGKTPMPAGIDFITRKSIAGVDFPTLNLDGTTLPKDMTTEIRSSGLPKQWSK